MKKLFFAIFFVLIFFLSGCLDSISDKGSTSNLCSKTSDCRLAYVGDNACQPCNTGVEDWGCLSADKAALTQTAGAFERISGFFSILFGETGCEVCGLQEFEYACSCEQGQCTKVVTGTNQLFCRQASDCEGKKLLYEECTTGFKGEWSCVQNTCIWECTIVEPESNPVTINEEPKPERIHVINCSDDNECFEQALLSCDKAIKEEENRIFRAGIVVVVNVKNEVIGLNDKGQCQVQITDTSQTGNVKVSDCLYKELHQIQCRVVSSTG